MGRAEADDIADPELSADVNFGPNLKWGLGLLLNEAQQSGMRAA